MVKNRNLIWIDYTKIFAIIGVATTHLYMSFEQLGWVKKTDSYYSIPIQIALVLFVQLFFVCSGFLYQQFRKDITVKGHFKNVLKKFIALGVPYFVFTIISLVIKSIFSGSVNREATPYLKTLFIKPMPPYWYLYVLFILFLIIPCVKDKRKLYAIFVASVILKLLYVFLSIKLPYIPMQIASNSIWFTFGMVLTTIKLKHNILEKVACIVLGCTGLSLAIYFFRVYNEMRVVRFSLSILLVLFCLYLFTWISKGNDGKIASKLRSYVLPVFLMHTIFAAGARTVLLKLGIKLIPVHILVGLIASFALPMLVYMFVKKKWYLLIFIEPLKAWKMRKQK